jgi:hypothetical protein
MQPLVRDSGVSRVANKSGSRSTSPKLEIYVSRRIGLWDWERPFTFSSGSAETVGVTLNKVRVYMYGNRNTQKLRSAVKGVIKLLLKMATQPVESRLHQLDGLDEGILPIVQVLARNGVETFESCEGGEGHAFYEPTVRFHGSHAEGFRALAIALQHGLKVSELRRYYSIEDGEPVGPHWEMTFLSGVIPLRGPAGRSPCKAVSHRCR